MKTQGRDGDTAKEVLDIAEGLLQVRGFNGFSYADVATELKLTKAALHYHFASKADLGEALVRRYTEQFQRNLKAFDSLPDAPSKLAAYVNLYADVLRNKRMCLCGMLAAEYQTLPENMREVLLRFFEKNEEWLINVLEEGQSAGSLSLDESPLQHARAIVGTLEGAMLVARPYRDISRFESTAAQMMRGLGIAAPRTSKPAKRSAKPKRSGTNPSTSS